MGKQVHGHVCGWNKLNTKVLSVDVVNYEEVE